MTEESRPYREALALRHLCDDSGYYTRLRRQENGTYTLWIQNEDSALKVNANGTDFLIRDSHGMDIGKVPDPIRACNILREHLGKGEGDW